MTYLTITWSNLCQGEKQHHELYLPATIGRGQGNDLRLDHPLVSRHHVRIELDGTGIVLRDMQSRNGVLLDGRKLSYLRIVGPTWVRIGPFSLCISPSLPKSH